MKRQGDTVDQMWQSSAEELIVAVVDLRVFQILNILNVKKPEAFVLCLSIKLVIKICVLKTCDQRYDKGAYEVRISVLDYHDRKKKKI